MKYEFILLNHFGVVAKRVCAAAAAKTAAHEGDDNTPSGPTGRGIKISVLVFLMDQNHKCPGYIIIKENTKETRSNISLTCIPSTTIAGTGQHSFNTCLRCTSYQGNPYNFHAHTEDVGLPTKFWLNIGPALQPIAGSISVNHLQRRTIY